MNLDEELSKMKPKEKVCIITSKGVKYTNSVKKAKKIMQYYLPYEVKDKKSTYHPKRFSKELKKITTIYI